jgi:SlyX protein
MGRFMSADKDTDNNLLVDLQTRLAFQDQTINELNDVVASQQQQIDRLQLHLKSFSDRLNGLEESVDKTAGIKPADEKPPHY